MVILNAMEQIGLDYQFILDQVQLDRLRCLHEGFSLRLNHQFTY